ncbi:hypothetical protein D3C73_1517840 [compost metagenome]
MTAISIGTIPQAPNIPENTATSIQSAINGDELPPVFRTRSAVVATKRPYTASDA